MQQINLLNSLPQKKLSLLRLWHIGALGLVIGILFISWSIHSHQQNNLLQKNLTTLVATQKSLNTQLIALSTRAHSEDKAELDAQTKLIQLLANKQIFSVMRFIKDLQLLADITPNNIWITHLSVDSTNGNLTLQGKAYQTLAVLNYVMVLNQADLFKQQPFSIVTLTQTDGQPAEILYTIRMQGAKKG